MAMTFEIIMIMMIISAIVVTQFSTGCTGLDPPWLLRAGALIARGDSIRIIGLIG